MSAGASSNKESSPELSHGPARKRRRRTVTTGATEDCFACRKRQTSCDRVRPFCGQCLALGQECSGYRTTLTWNVGVASRGKLRGLALPVVGDAETSTPQSDEVEADKHPLPKKAAHQRPSISRQAATTSKRKRSFEQSSDIEQIPVSTQRSGTSKTWSLQSFQRESLSKNTHTFAVTMEHHSSPDGSASSPRTSSKYSWSTNTLSPRSIPTPRADMAQTTEYVPTSEPISNLPNPSLQHYYQPNEPIPPSHVHSTGAQNLLPGHFRPGFIESSTSLNTGIHGIPSPADSHSTQSMFDDEAAFASAMMTARTHDGWMLDNHSFFGEEEDDDNNWGQGSITKNSDQIQQALVGTPLYQLPRRMRYLLDFYAQAICPVLVTFDGPSNPYRDHIMRLALDSPGLQHAIAALVTNNIRMRRCEYVPWRKQKKERRSQLTAPSQPTEEEQFYKSKSIQLLNEQLRSGNCAEDSVFATLLVLCLFHVCNSGVTKFKTQLAGVQKLLRMRSFKNKEARSDFIGWVEMFFAWFDVMTSAVNNRETEIRGDSLDLTDFTANLGALEHYSGCDGRLFKLIARLGRLNLLSQSRAVREEAMHGPLARPDGAQAWSDWAQPTQSDHRNAFWREWHDLRERLYAWNFKGYKTAVDRSQLTLPERHIWDISEAFRWSAILYTERLAYPNLPSKSPNIQALVDRTMSHIDAIGVNSCVTKFLLWPLFVTGTECVRERDRGMIRDRCVEIQKESGFYNNISGLQVLERMWNSSDVDGDKIRAPHGQAFWWRTAMDRVDGEYVVI